MTPTDRARRSCSFKRRFWGTFAKCNYALRRAEEASVFWRRTRAFDCAFGVGYRSRHAGNSAVRRWSNSKVGREGAYGSARRVNSAGIMRSDVAHVNAVINARRWRFVGSNAPNTDAAETSKSDGRTTTTQTVFARPSPRRKNYPSSATAFHHQDQRTTAVFRIVLKSINVSNARNISSGERLPFSYDTLTFFHSEI